MSKKTKFWLVSAVLLVLIGALVFIVAIAMNDWSFKKLWNNEYVTNTYDVNNDFNNISIDVDTADITFVLSNENICKVVCNETEKITHTVSIDNNTLNIVEHDNRRWYNYIGFFYGSPEMTIYLPQNEYMALMVKNSTGNITIPNGFTFSDLTIKASTGDVQCNATISNSMRIDVSTGDVYINNVSTTSMTISTSTGKIKLENINVTGNVETDNSTGKVELINVNCKNLKSNGNTGSIIFTNVIVIDEMYIHNSTGSVKLYGCDAGTIKIKTSTGDVKGTLLSDKIFIVDTSNGDVDVPKTISGGICDITTSTGDISIQIQS